MKRSAKTANARRVCFRRWDNKSYSIFKSLGMLVKVSVISATYSILAMPMATFAQPDTVAISKNVDIDEVVICSPQAVSTYSDLTRAVLVITSDEISQLPVSSINDLLENLASIDVRQRGSNGVQADLIVRGGSFDQVLILLNGVNITDPQTGHHNLNIPIDLESVDRIEILQGPGARVYGPGAFSGAINIITTTNKKSKARVAATAGEFGLFKLSSSASYKKDKTKLFIAASQARSDGYIKNTDFNLYNLFAHSNYQDDSNTIDIQLGYQNKAFGAQSFYTPKYPEQFEQTSTFFTSASYSKKVASIILSPQVYIRNHNDRFELFRYEAPNWYNGHNYHSTLVSGGKIEASVITDFEKIRFGVELRNEKIISNVLGTNLEIPKPISGEDNKHYDKGATRTLFNAFADYTIYLNSFTLSAGALISESREFGYNHSFGFDMSYRVSRMANIFASISNAIRFPTFTDLYYQGPTNFGNANLKPENAYSYEMGFKHNSNTIKADVTIYHRRGKNVIDWVKLPHDERWTTMNHTKINSTGLETLVKINTKEMLPVINNISLGYHFMQSDKKSGELQSFYALDYLKHKATFSASHKIYKNFSASWTAIWQKRAGAYTDYPSNIETPYNHFTTVNFRTSWSHKSFKAFFEIINIGNVSYIDLGNIVQPGRWLSAGISFEIGQKDNH
jgi:iron complex outermembrane receptor protein